MEMEKDYIEERKQDKKKRNIVLLYFLVAILFISIGYATLATVLGINGGNIKMTKAVWKVYFSSVDDNKTGNVTPIQAATISTDKKEIDFSIQLDEIGDKYVFDAVITNDSSYDAELQSDPTLVLKKDGSIVPLPSYLTYKVVDSTNHELAAGYEVLANSSKTVTVTVEYAESDELSDEDMNYSLSYTMNFVSK